MGGLRIEAAISSATEETASLLRTRPAACEVELPHDASGERHRKLSLRARASAVMSSIWSILSTKSQKPMFTTGNVPLVVLGVLTLAAGAYLIFSAKPETNSVDQDLRVVLLADAHLIGPQYVCCTERWVSALPALQSRRGVARGHGYPWPPAHTGLLSPSPSFFKGLPADYADSCPLPPCCTPHRTSAPYMHTDAPTNVSLQCSPGGTRQTHLATPRAYGVFSRSL